MSSNSKIGKLFMTFLGMLLGVTLTPTIDNTVSSQLVNLTGAAGALKDIIPVVWIFIVLGAGVSYLATLYNKL